MVDSANPQLEPRLEPVGGSTVIAGHRDKDERILVPCFEPPNVSSPEQNWLTFDGGLAMSLGGTVQRVSHHVRAPG